MVGLGVDYDDVVDYVDNNDMGTAVLLARPASSAVPRPHRPREQHGGLRRGPIPLSQTRSRRARSPRGGRARGRSVRTTMPAVRLRPPAGPSSRRPRRSTPATSTPPPNSTKNTSVARSRASTTTSLSRPCVTTTSTDPACPATPPTPASRASFAALSHETKLRRYSKTAANERDFVHVQDVATANLLALTVTQPFDGPLNVASGTPRTVLDMAAALGGTRSAPTRRMRKSPARTG